MPDEYEELPDEAVRCLTADDPNKAADDAPDDEAPCGDFAPDELGEGCGRPAERIDGKLLFGRGGDDGLPR